MKLIEIFLFELSYQFRRFTIQILFIALFSFTAFLTLDVYLENALIGEYYLNSPFVIFSITLIVSFLGLLITAALASDAAVRDIETRISPILFSSPISKNNYLGGRFFGVIFINGLILFIAPIIILISTILPGIPSHLLGSFHSLNYFAPYLLITLPNVFIGTSFVYCISVLTRKTMAGFMIAVLLIFASAFSWLFIAMKTGNWELAKILDPLGISIFSEISRSTTSSEKNILVMMITQSLLLNRVVWIGISSLLLLGTFYRFRFDQSDSKVRIKSLKPIDSAAYFTPVHSSIIEYPRFEPAFNLKSQLLQIWFIALKSFREAAVSWGGLLLFILATLLIILGPDAISHMGISIIPTTQQLTEFVGNKSEIIWLIVPLFTIYFAGELVWSERNVRFNEISDAFPVINSVRLLGKFIGLVFVFITYQSLLMLGCILVQIQLGYFQFEFPLYLKIFFGLQLSEHILFAVLAFTLHILVNQKYVGYLCGISLYIFTVFAPEIGLEHSLLIYGSSPEWAYSDMHGFEPNLSPWLYFKLYWAAWALLFLVLANIYWIRGTEVKIFQRIRQSKFRFQRATIVVGIIAFMMMISVGGYIFYNTNILNIYLTAQEFRHLQAKYELQYSQYSKIPQPTLESIDLNVELYPELNEANISGKYYMVNHSGSSIKTIHVAIARDVEIENVTFDQNAVLIVEDNELFYHIYELETPLLPTDSLQMNFMLDYTSNGFRNNGYNASVISNGTYIVAQNWLPQIGYRRNRELSDNLHRKELGLPHRPVHELNARYELDGNERIHIEVVIGTTENQTAIGPGSLQQNWIENERQYFHYKTEVPIRNDFAIYSADYSNYKTEWVDSTSGKTVLIELYHHPEHHWNIARMALAVQESLEFLSQQLGPYPHRQIRFVEHPGSSLLLHAAPINISFKEGFSVLNPDLGSVDFPFAVVAHEVSHQWWGNIVSPAYMEGGALLTESLSWYSAMNIVENIYEERELEKLTQFLKQVYQMPHSRAGVPLLQADDWLGVFRKGPFAFYTLREYLGNERMNKVLRNFFNKHKNGTIPLPTSRDLFNEIREVTPDSLQYLLTDLFEVNTYWELKIRDVKIVPVDDDWLVTIQLETEKMAVDTLGIETILPMDDWIEIGVYGVDEENYLQKHRIKNGKQQIEILVPNIPTRVGIDPRNLLTDTNTQDNFMDV